MQGWQESLYGARFADIYDDKDYGAAQDTEEAVAFLSSLVEPGARLLELGSGTGRLLLPLAERGFAVQGVDISPEMVERMRAREAGAHIPVLIGDMAEFELDAEFDLVYLAYNTLFHLETQERQVACIAAAARHLASAGLLVCEAYAPYPLCKLPNRNVLTFAVGVDEVILLPTLHNEIEQLIDSSVVVIRESGNKIYSNRHRYAWPPEIDLMAQLAGLELRERWFDYERHPFIRGSDGHVSVYARREA